jgi:penicillin-binding protein 1A
LELAASYAVFANGGRPVRPYAVLNVSDRSGQIVFTHPKNTELAPVLSTATAFVMRDMMSGVIRPGGTAYFAARAAAFNREAAGKTGTTNDYRDAWFAGIIPGVAAAVRIGNDDMRFPLGPGRSGGAVAAPIWMRFILDAMRYQPTLKFDRPEPS